jgi:hypothetical protein
MLNPADEPIISRWPMPRPQSGGKHQGSPAKAGSTPVSGLTRRLALAEDCAQNSPGSDWHSAPLPSHSKDTVITFWIARY